jgi:site-specific recombinase XerD
MKLPTVAIVFNRLNSKNKTGMYSLHLRITIERHSKYVSIPLPQKISPSDWNVNNKGDYYIKNSHPFAFEINQKIIELKNKANEVIKRHYLQNKSITFNTLLQQLNRNSAKLTFNEFAAEYIKNPKEKFELATITKYNTFLKHLNDFNKQIHFNDLTPELVVNFRTHLEVKLNLAGSTMKSYFDKFKKIVNQAEREGYLDYQQTRFLFTDAKIKVNEANRTFLEIEEIQRLIQLKFKQEEQHLERDRDLFLFQIYTGLYYNDLLNEKKSVGLFLISRRDKNNNKTIIPLYKFPNSLKIIEKYSSVDKNDELVFDAKYIIEDQPYNRNLKELGAKANIKKNISNKVARHTNAQLWIRYGTAREVVSKMMGHVKSETTEEYFKININDVEEGVKHINFKDLGL